jgi:hypothetical protein
MLHLERGTPDSCGNWQASALTATTTLGGKASGAPSPWFLFETVEASLEETLAPLADDLSWRVQAGRDLIVAESVSGVQHDPGSDDVSIWRRIDTPLRLEFRTLFS